MEKSDRDTETNISYVETFYPLDETKHFARRERVSACRRKTPTCGRNCLAGGEVVLLAGEIGNSIPDLVPLAGEIVFRELCILSKNTCHRVAGAAETLGAALGRLFQTATKDGVARVASGLQPLFDPATGKMTLSMFSESKPTYDAIKDVKGLTESGASYYEDHHIVFRKLIEILQKDFSAQGGRPSLLKAEITPDSSPSMLLAREANHRPLHEVMDPLVDALRADKLEKDITVADVINVLKDGYKDPRLNLTDEAKVVEMWLNAVKK